MKREDLKLGLVVRITKGKYEGMEARVIDLTGGCVFVKLETGLHMGIEIEIHEAWLEVSEPTTWYVCGTANKKRINVKVYGLHSAYEIAKFLKSDYKYVSVNHNRPKLRGGK